MATQPDFIEYATEDTVPGPVMFRDMKARGWILKADRDRLQERLNPLNTIGGRDPGFQPLTSHVVLTFGHYPSAYAASRPDVNQPYKEVAVWLPAVATKGIPGTSLKKGTIVFYLPYLWVDSPYALMEGSDVLGLRKHFAHIEVPEDPAECASDMQMCLLRAFGAKVSAHTTAEFLDLLSVTGSPRGPLSHLLDFGSAIKAILQVLIQDFQSIRRFDWSLEKAIISSAASCLVHRTLSSVALRQYRSPIDLTKASLQQLVFFSVPVTKFVRAGVLPGKYRLKLSEVPYIPLRKHLGLELTADGVMELDFAFHMEMGFEFNGAEVVAANPPGDPVTGGEAAEGPLTDH